MVAEAAIGTDVVIAERDALAALAAQQQATIEALQQTISVLEGTATKQKEQIAGLWRLVARLESKLEAVLKVLQERDADRAAKERAEVEAEKAAVGPPPPPGTEVPKPPPRPPKDERKKGRHAHGRSMDVPPGTPVHETEHRPEACGTFGCEGTAEDLRVVDEVVHEWWDYVEGYIRRRRQRCKTCKCEECGQRTTAEPAELAPFARASCSIALLVHVLYAKFALHLPLERQAADFTRRGVRLAPSTLVDWVAQAAALFAPLVALLWEQLLASGAIHLDATGLSVLRGGPGKAHRGQVYVICTLQIAVFKYLPTKEAEPLYDLLAAFRGSITADAASTHDRLFEEGSGRKEQGCNSHAFRKFREAAKTEPELAAEGMAFIAAIFREEQTAKAQGLEGDALLTFRQARIRPLADQLHTWLRLRQHEILPKSPLAKAIRYDLNHWKALTAFIDDPRLAAENNLAERLLKVVALGRKNYNFAGSEVGAQTAATIYSVIETCKLQQVDPVAYMTWALAGLAQRREHGGIKLRDLLPSAYRATLKPARPP